MQAESVEDQKQAEAVDPADLAAPVLERYKPSKDALKLHTENAKKIDFAEALLSAGLWEEAVLFIAHALPRRKALWWASQCARESHQGEEMEPADEKALEAGEKWSIEPTEKRRRTAQAAAEATEFKTVAGAVAAAAFYSSGSISTPEAPVLEPPAHVFGDAIRTAVVCSKARVKDPLLQQELQKKIIAMVKDLDSTAGRWQEVAMAVAAEHTTKAGVADDEEERLREAAKIESTLLPSEIDDKRMNSEIEAVLGPKRAAEKKQAEEMEALKKAAEEAQKKAKKPR